ncbi:MAG TPA: PepSY-associated TM helix domain-containing protein [Cyclobacteriaceae bacterium]|nr:PepSY domain-containing protein [Cyclobacteriaceae bacterium]MCB9237926.1 PepSY domain-containing protein [Flammeovirgaceae bacterium]MCB0499234.1 PepSY domain-containing protein [Cyclobacteriaceae bacterium]MCO5271923.1 PepSY domain-containing protein [Cyclobacteriaceae bacterium]MCW5902469.1 PepSY domain-containing protein [Cyclobacteriaceae bacterium]
MNYRKITGSLRKFRTWHRFIGTGLGLFMLLTASTGILLGWKKNVDILQPPAQKGTSTDLAQWVSIQTIVRTAVHAVDSVVGRTIEVDKLDVRPSKGIVKVIFKERNWEVQVDGATGKSLSVLRRHSDWIEHLHDGSIISDFVKITYTNLMGWGLLILSLSGFWLWYGPKIVKKIKAN